MNLIAIPVWVNYILLEWQYGLRQFWPLFICFGGRNIFEKPENTINGIRELCYKEEEASYTRTHTATMYVFGES